jgi:hypothetical protein
MTRYRVVAPYATCRSREAARLMATLAPYRPPQELAISGYNRDAILPESVPQEDLDRLLAVGHIEAVEE